MGNFLKDKIMIARKILNKRTLRFPDMNIGEFVFLKKIKINNTFDINEKNKRTKLRKDLIFYNLFLKHLGKTFLLSLMKVLLDLYLACQFCLINLEEL